MLRFCTRVVFVLALAFFNLSFASASANSKLENSKAYAHYLTGALLDNFSQSEEALSEFQQARRFDPNSDLINLRIAVDLVKLGRNKEAIEELNKGLQLDPDNLQERTLLAFLYTTSGEPELAEIQYEIILKQASAEDPDNLQARFFLGQLYFQQRKFDKAKELFNLILSKNPKDVQAKLFLGLTFDEQGQRQSAIKEFKGILDIDPENPDALNALGYSYAEFGENLEEAQALINKALGKEPKNGAYIDSLGWVYFQKGEFEKAKEKLEEAAKLIEDPIIFDHLADVYFKLGDSKKAKEAWQKALELKPRDEKTVKQIQTKIKKIK